MVANIGVALKLQISQRTKSGTFARHTKPTHKSQPCKRACLVPTLPGHTLPRWTHTFNSSYQDEGRTYNIGFASMLADVVTMSCISLSAIIGLDLILFSFLLLTSTSVFQLGCSSGLDIIKYQHSSKPWPLYVTLISILLKFKLT